MSEMLFITLIFFLFLSVISFIYNNVIIVKKYKLKLNRNSDGVRIVFLADVFSNNHIIRINKIILKTERCNPDVIFLTGDREKGGKYSNEIVEKLSKIAPTYILSEDKKGEIKIFNNFSLLTLMSDDSKDVLLPFEELENVKVLFLETPALFDESVYSKDIDIVLAFHGGGLKIRIPFYGMIYTEKEGFLPQYPARFYRKNNTALVTTTGVGKSFLPLRVNNLREIVCIDIKN